MNIIPTEQEISTLAKIGAMAIKSGFLPNSIKTPEQAIIIALKGKELGIPPFQSFSQIAVVQGKPTISAELMLALIYKNVQSAEINFIKTDNTACTIEARRNKDSKYSKFEFNINDAKQAGLMGKDNWNKYTAAMLRARAISAMARALFADAIAGCSYVPEELGAEVNEDGEVIQETSVKADYKKKVKAIDAEVLDSNKIENKGNVSEFKEAELDEAKNYVLTFTKQSGMTLGEVYEKYGADHLIQQCDKIESHYAKKGLALDDQAMTYLKYAKTLIAQANV